MTKYNLVPITEEQDDLLERIEELYNDVIGGIYDNPTPEQIAEFKQRWTTLLDEVIYDIEQEKNNGTGNH